MKWTVKKKVNFVNLSQIEGLSAPGLALSFDIFGFNFMAHLSI
jgi:hypothetical protein